MSAEWCCCVLTPTLPQYLFLNENSTDSSAVYGKNSKATSPRNLEVGNSDELPFQFPDHHEKKILNYKIQFLIYYLKCVKHD